MFGVSLMKYSPQILHNADRNFYFASHLFARFATKGAEDLSLGGGMSHCGMSIYQFNNAFPGVDSKEMGEFVEGANLFFGEKSLDYQLMLTDSQNGESARMLGERGLTCDARVPAMLLSIENLVVPKPSDYPLEIVEVTTPDQLQDYLKVCAASYSFPDFIGDRIFNNHYLEDPAAILYLGYDEGEAAAASMRVEDPNEKGQTDALAGIYWVGTKPEFRKRGHGERLTHFACEQAREDGFSIVSLQASEMGEPIYKRMGFETTGYYHRYIKQWPR